MFETGVKYDFKFLKDQDFKFVPKEDGILRIYAQETNISVSTEGDDERCTTVLG